VGQGGRRPSRRRSTSGSDDVIGVWYPLAVLAPARGADA
jgi:hypothetical protein